jgi:hypothetical protein
MASPVEKAAVRNDVYELVRLARVYDEQGKNAELAKVGVALVQVVRNLNPLKDKYELRYVLNVPDVSDMQAAYAAAANVLGLPPDRPKDQDVSDDQATEPAVKCMRCERDAFDGRHVTVAVDIYPRWVWLTLLLGVLPFFIFYEVTKQRPRPIVSYSLCQSCWRRRTAWQVVAGVAWAMFVGFLVAGAVTGEWDLWGGMDFWLFFGALSATLAASLKRLSGEQMERLRSSAE